MSHLRLSPLMTIVLVLLMALNGFLLMPPNKQRGRAEVAAATPATANWRSPQSESQSAFQLKPIETYVQTATRPVFSKTRRPFMPPTPAATEVTAPAPALATPPPLPEPAITVTGIASGMVKQALVVTTAFPNGEWYQVGASIEGWILVEVGPDSVTLRNGVQAFRRKMFADVNVAPRRPSSAKR